MTNKRVWGESVSDLISYALLLIMMLSLLPALNAQLTTRVTIQNSAAIAYGNTVTAVSGSAEDIQAAVDWVEAAGGGTVYVPAGNFSFDILRGVTIHGGVSIIGAGKDKTILYMPNDVSPWRDGLRMFRVYGENGNPVRISGISFVGYQARAPDNVYTGIAIFDSKDFRVDNCSFKYLGMAGIKISNIYYPSAISRGVIDHNDFLYIYKNPDQTTYGYGVDVEFDAVTWEPNIDKILGKYGETVFIENNYFEGERHAVAAGTGAHYVFRYNIVNDTFSSRGFHMVDAHGQVTSGETGTRAIEVYNNTIWDYGNGQAVSIRGGGGVIFNNTIRNMRYGIDLTSEYVDNVTYRAHDVWMWENTYENVSTEFYTSGSFQEGVDYFFFKNPGYEPYPYPHPLTLGS